MNITGGLEEERDLQKQIVLGRTSALQEEPVRTLIS